MMPGGGSGFPNWKTDPKLPCSALRRGAPLRQLQLWKPRLASSRDLYTAIFILGRIRLTGFGYRDSPRGAVHRRAGLGSLDEGLGWVTAISRMILVLIASAKF